jgi:phosphoribosylanthranilate isomerase
LHFKGPIEIPIEFQGRYWLQTLGCAVAVPVNVDNNTAQELAGEIAGCQAVLVLAGHNNKAVTQAARNAGIPLVQLQPVAASHGVWALRARWGGAESSLG